MNGGSSLKAVGSFLLGGKEGGSVAGWRYGSGYGGGEGAFYRIERRDLQREEKVADRPGRGEGVSYLMLSRK